VNSDLGVVRTVCVHPCVPNHVTHPVDPPPYDYVPLTMFCCVLSVILSCQVAYVAPPTVCQQQRDCEHRSLSHPLIYQVHMLLAPTNPTRCFRVRMPQSSVSSCLFILSSHACKLRCVYKQTNKQKARDKQTTSCSSIII
jgi:hypothetical protein